MRGEGSVEISSPSPSPLATEIRYALSCSDVYPDCWLVDVESLEIVMWRGERWAPVRIAHRLFDMMWPMELHDTTRDAQRFHRFRALYDYY